MTLRGNRKAAFRSQSSGGWDFGHCTQLAQDSHSRHALSMASTGTLRFSTLVAADVGITAARMIRALLRVAVMIDPWVAGQHSCL